MLNSHEQCIAAGDNESLSVRSHQVGQHIVPALHHGSTNQQLKAAPDTAASGAAGPHLVQPGRIWCSRAVSGAAGPYLVQPGRIWCSRAVSGAAGRAATPSRPIGLVSTLVCLGLRRSRRTRVAAVHIAQLQLPQLDATRNSATATAAIGRHTQ